MPIGLDVLWSVVVRYGELHLEKIIMKHELKHIPGPGKLVIGKFQKGEHDGVSFNQLVRCLGGCWTVSSFSDSNW